MADGSAGRGDAFDFAHYVAIGDRLRVMNGVNK
jgi:hypothetical protein